MSDKAQQNANSHGEINSALMRRDGEQVYRPKL